MTRLLLIDDDVQLTGLLAEYLKKDGFDVTVHNSAMTGLACLRQNSFDLLILDVMMPLMDGITLLREVRHSSSIPVIMLTARGDNIDRIVGLELGADDYVPKPCLPREIVARVRAILRRASDSNNAPKQALQLGPLEVQPAKRKVLLNGQEIELTSAEFNLLEVLASHAGQVVSKTALSEQGLGRPLERFDRSIDVHLSSLRNKLNLSNAQLPLTLHTIRGQGYQLSLD